MKRAVAILVTALSLSLAGAAADAQAGMPPSGAYPGAVPVDSSRVVRTDQQDTSDYNTLAGRGVKVQRVNGDASNSRPVAAKPVKASAADVQSGAAVRAVDGPQIGTVLSLDAEQVVVDTGETKIGVPLLGFGKDEKGLVLNMTVAKFKDAVAKAHARTEAQAQQQPQ